MREVIAVTLLPIAFIVGSALVMERLLHGFVTTVRFVRYQTQSGDDAE